VPVPLAYVGYRWKTGQHMLNASFSPFDPGYVKTLRGMTAPEILRLVVTLRAKKCKNSSFALHYDQIRFRFCTAKTRFAHGRD
jgi:hypothetical protein